MPVFIDLTEFLNAPHRTGIQRVCGELCRFWPADYPLIPVKLTKTLRIVLLQPESLHVIRKYFESSNSNDTNLKNTLDVLASQGETSEREVDWSTGDRLLVPEVFYDLDRIDFYQNLPPERAKNVYFLLYDFLPLTHPDFFPPDLPHEKICRYFQLVRSVRNVSFISALTKEVYYRRILRRSSDGGPVLRLGSDGLGPRPRSVPSRHPSPKFTVLGTIEPRKNHALVLEVFEPLFKEIKGLRLVFMGKMGWVDPALAERIHSLTRDCPGFEHYASPSDDLIRQHVEESWATVYLSVAEGYGLPPVESLWLGTPVIASPFVPSLEAIGSTGVHFVEPLNLSTLREAALAIAEESYARRKSEEALSLNLPTWRSFAREVAEWIHASDSSKALD